MVAPINYSLNVLDPIQGYLGGLKFGEGLQTDRLARAQTQQSMDQQAQTFTMQKAAAEKAVADAAAGQSAITRLIDLGPNATPDDFMKAWAANPAMRDDIASLQTALTKPKVDELIKTTQNVYVSAASGNVDATRNQIQTQYDAALNSGDEAMASGLKSVLDQFDKDPQGALNNIKMTSGLTLGGLVGFDKLKQINEGLGFVAQEYRAATAEEAAAYGAAAGQINTKTGEFKAINPPTGFSVTTTPEGGTTITQGPGVGGVDTGKRAQDYVYTTDAAGRQVAQPIAGTPAALQVTETAGKLDAAIEVGNNMLATIESIVGRPAGNGLTAIKPNEALPGILGMFEGRLPGKTQAETDLLAKVEQVQGQAFLEAFNILKGAGAITETEGTRATQAYARLQRTQSPEAFQASLNEFADIVRLGIKRAQDQKMALPQIAPVTAEGSGLPQSFLSDQSAIDAAKNAGVTLQDMWNIMTPANKARYGK
jgi:hypothetical protein